MTRAKGFLVGMSLLVIVDCAGVPSVSQVTSTQKWSPESSEYRLPGRALGDVNLAWAAVTKVHSDAVLSEFDIRYRVYPNGVAYVAFFKPPPRTIPNVEENTETVTLAGRTYYGVSVIGGIAKIEESEP